MKSIYFCATIGLSLFCSLPLCAESWTDAQGRSLDAEVVAHDFEKDMVEFLLPTGRNVKMKISVLSDESKGRLRLMDAETEKKLERLVPGTLVKFTPAGDMAQYTYHCYVPTNYTPDHRTPILFAFSPGGSGKGILKHFQDAAEAKGWLVVGFDKLKNGMTWSDEERDKTHEMLFADVAKNIPHHPYRIVMGGTSGGGWRSFQIAMAFPEKPFAGILSCGGWMGKDYADNKITTHMAVAIVNGNTDAAANSYVARNTTFLEGFHARVKRFTFIGGHKPPPKETTLEAFNWFEEDWKTTGMKEQLKKMRAK